MNGRAGCNDVLARTRIRRERFSTTMVVRDVGLRYASVCARCCHHLSVLPMRFLANAVAIMGALAPLPAGAKNVKTDFADKGMSCWRRDADDHGARLCFREDGSVVGETSAGAEGFSERGLFRSDRFKIVVLGFPGQGWPAPEPAASCSYTFTEADRVLILRDCSLAGRWHRE